MRARICVLLMLAAVGCGAPKVSRVPEPADTAAAFFAAVEADDPAAAYGLLSPSARRDMARARWDALWRENRAEMEELAAAAARTDRPAVAQAWATLENQETVELVLEDGRWRLAGGVLDAQALSTPLDAVAALRRALLRQSLPSLLRVLSRQRRAAWLASFEETMERSEDTLDLRVETQGDEAIVHLRGGGEIHLKHEAGKWHVWDVR